MAKHSQWTVRWWPKLSPGFTAFELNKVTFASRTRAEQVLIAIVQRMDVMDIQLVEEAPSTPIRAKEEAKP
jgi:hypothetical protein